MIKKNDRTRTYYDEIWAWMFSKKMENMVMVILCMKCILCVDDMKSWMDTTGVVNWSNCYGLTPKSLGGGGLKFESHNEKCLGNNFMLWAHTY